MGDHVHYQLFKFDDIVEVVHVNDHVSGLLGRGLGLASFGQLSTQSALSPSIRSRIWDSSRPKPRFPFFRPAAALLFSSHSNFPHFNCQAPKQNIIREFLVHSLANTMENEDLAVGPSSRESSFDPPVYNIYHGKDHTLQWHPAVGSKELAVALSYHFPLETSMERKMRAATKKFLKEEKRKGERSSGHSSVFVGLASVAEESAEGATSGQLLSKESFPELPIEPKNSDLSVNDHTSYIFPVTVSKPEPAHLQETTKSEVAEFAVSRPSHEEPTPKILSWVHAGDSKEPKRRKRRYGMLEAAEVAANRGNACDDHRKRKVKVSFSSRTQLANF